MVSLFSPSGPVGAYLKSFAQQANEVSAMTGPAKTTFGEQTAYQPMDPRKNTFGNDLSTGFAAPRKSTGVDFLGPQQQQSSQTTPQQGQTGTSLGGDWSGVDQWNMQIQSAASATGVDPNMIKAIMKLESGGDANAGGAAGVWGPMQVNSNAWGYGPWSTDPTANILKGAQIYKQMLDQYGGDSRMALRAYHGFGSDGYTDDQQYADIVLGNYNQLNLANSGAGLGAYPSGGAGLSSVFGANSAVPDWGEFNVPSDLPYYSYGNQYGMNGYNHTGVDVPMPYGSQYTAGFNGHVVCAGTGYGTGEDSCDAFADKIGGGAGRVEIISDDGNTVLIYGHSSRSALAPGTRVQAGQLLGWSGGENSEHVHLEARVRDASTPSGWRIVDPRTILGGGGGSFAGSGFTSGGGGSNYAPGSVGSINEFLRNWRSAR